MFPTTTCLQSLYCAWLSQDVGKVLNMSPALLNRTPCLRPSRPWLNSSAFLLHPLYMTCLEQSCGHSINILSMTEWINDCGHDALFSFNRFITCFFWYFISNIPTSYTFGNCSWLLLLIHHSHRAVQSWAAENLASMHMVFLPLDQIANLHGAKRPSVHSLPDLKKCECLMGNNFYSISGKGKKLWSVSLASLCCATIFNKATSLATWGESAAD